MLAKSRWDLTRRLKGKKILLLRRSVLNFVIADECKADPFHKAGYAGKDDRNCQMTKNNKFLSWVSQIQVV